MADCLVTGGCGFIGSHLVEALLAAGRAVRVLDDLSTGASANLRPVWRKVEFLRGGVTDPDAVRVALRGVGLVFHLAALPSVARSLEDPLASHAACATGTLVLLEEARGAGVGRVVYAASSSAYGDAPGVLRREGDPCRPPSPYAAAKLAGEHYCRCFSRAFGLETVSLRLFNVYGPRQDPHSPYAGVVARFAAALARGESPTVHGDGLQSRDFTYVADAVRAFLLAARAPSACGQVYNVGAGGRTSVLDLLGQLNDLLGSKIQPVFAPAREGDVRHSQADVTRAQADLGYRPGVSLREGLRLTLAYHRDPTGAPTAGRRQP
jgi:UDP-glucose 4-epimerase